MCGGVHAKIDIEVHVALQRKRHRLVDRLREHLLLSAGVQPHKTGDPDQVAFDAARGVRAVSLVPNVSSAVLEESALDAAAVSGVEVLLCVGVDGAVATKVDGAREDGCVGDVLEVESVIPVRKRAEVEALIAESFLVGVQEETVPGEEVADVVSTTKLVSDGSRECRADNRTY